MEHGVLSRNWSSLGEVRQALSPAGLGAPLAYTMWRLAAVAQVVENTVPEQAVNTHGVYGTLRVGVFRRPGMPPSDLSFIFHSP